MRYSRCSCALVVAGLAALAAAPLQAARPGIAINICGQPGIEIMLPLAPRQPPARDDGACSCHACNTRTRAFCCDDDESS